jgi:quinol---cytochrome c reductase iron-sulfur subunit
MTVLRWLWRIVVAAILLILRRRAPRPAPADERTLPANTGAERTVAALLVASSLASAGAVTVYVLGANTQLLGATLAVAMGLIAAALVVAAKRVVVQEQSTEERPDFALPAAEGEDADGPVRTSRELRAGVEGVTRRRLLVVAGGGAGAALGAAVVVPLASLGPKIRDGLVSTPFRDGTRLVDEHSRPVRAADIPVRGFTTAFAEGANHSDEGAVVVVVHVEPSTLVLPAGREGWAPDGFVAYSKICTHAGCAVNLDRSPLYPPVSPGPALVCPCHYSTFDVLRGGNRVFGPAGRPLPQLPLRIEAGLLVAAGDFSGRVGPSWSGVRE